MTGVTGADRTPTLTAVFVEQVRAVGLAVRREAVAAGVLMCLPWLGAAVLTRAGLTVVDGRPFEPIPLDPGDGTVALAALAAVVFAWLVWRGEAPFGDAAPWSLPVDHRRHMLTRVAAGWVWLMVFVGAVWLWIVVMTAASGRAPGVDRMQVLILDPAGAVAGAAGATEWVRWVTPWWQWLLPFTAGTVGYLAVTALLLGTRWPLVWGVAIWMGFGAVVGMGDAFDIPWILGAFRSGAQALGAWEGFRQWVDLPSGDHALAWRALPSLSTWASNTAIWTAVGVAGLWAALARPRDH